MTVERIFTRAAAGESQTEHDVVRVVADCGIKGDRYFAGTVRFRGVELCEPCLGLGQVLATSAIPPPKVVKRLVHRGGLRPDALSGGEVAVGARFRSAA